LKQYIVENNLIGAGKRFAVVVSGANMNFGRLRFVAERAELGEGREVLFSVEIPEIPGRPPSLSSSECDSLLRFLKVASCGFTTSYFPEQ
jgi:threonine dehydratase